MSQAVNVLGRLVKIQLHLVELELILDLWRGVVAPILPILARFICHDDPSLRSNIWQLLNPWDVLVLAGHLPQRNSRVSFAGGLLAERRVLADLGALERPRKRLVRLRNVGYRLGWLDR